MDIDSRTRKWQITINNPVEKGYTHDKIIEISQTFKGLIYMCMSDEIGENGTFHTHIYMHFSSAVYFSTIKKRFEGGHFEMARGTSAQNRDYVFKEGKWLNDKKNDTNIIDSHYEYGDLPIERQGQGCRNDLYDLYDMIKSGASNYDIITECPSFIKDIDKLDKVRFTLKENEYKNKWRNLETTYIYGATGTGKTRSVMETYGYENVYRITDYAHPFDNYKGQDIILFEEFRSSLSLSDMLKYLDGYPVELPCRYSNKIACFTKVFICSNISLSKQYVNIQNEEYSSYEAFLRRIQYIRKFTKYTVYDYTLNEYLSGWRKCVYTPFENSQKII